MPYKVEGNNVMHMKDGKWTIKQHAKSHKNALRAMRLLYMVEGGGKPTGKKAEK